MRRRNANDVRETKDQRFCEKALDSGRYLSFRSELHRAIIGNRQDWAHILGDLALAKVAVYRGTRCEIEAAYSELTRYLKRIKCRKKCVAQIDIRIGDPCGNIGIRGKMPNRIKLD